jgi:hypothetical protein
MVAQLGPRRADREGAIEATWRRDAVRELHRPHGRHGRAGAPGKRFQRPALPGEEIAVITTRAFDIPEQRETPSGMC